MDLSLEHPELEDAELRKSLRALGAWVFHGDASALSPEDLVRTHYSTLLAGIFRDSLPEDVALNAKKFFRLQQARDLALQQTMQQIARLLTENKIPFCPLKGADLAPRVYPSGALRPRGDIDVLIPVEYRKAAVERLREKGWQQPYRYTNDNHESEMFRNGICLELHHKLPNFSAHDMPEVWQESVETAPYCHHLSLEFNLLMLFQHSQLHKWRNPALLLDCGFLLKNDGKPDWGKLHAAAKKMHLYDPALYFRALEDFFPPETMPEETFPPDICAGFRNLLFLQKKKLFSRKELAMGDAHRFSRKWWSDRLYGLRPSVIRRTTGNPRGHYGKLWKDYLIINGGKFFAFLSGLCQLRQGKFPADRLRREIEKKHLKPWR